MAGDPSLKDLEKLVFLGWFSAPDPQSRSPAAPPGLKPKQGPLKVEKRKVGLRKGPESLEAHRRVGSSRLLGLRDGRGAQNGGSGSEGDTKTSREIPSQEPPEAEAGPGEVRLCKLESRRAPRKEAPGPTQQGLVGPDPEEDQEERRKKKRSDVMDRFRLKHLEKSVSIRLVDIRNSDGSGFISRSPFGSSVLLSDVAVGNKADAWLKKPAASGRPAAGGHLRSWGRFRIPKRTEKTAGEERQLALPNASSQPRTRLRTGAENTGYSPKAGEGEVEACLKRCHSHQLRGDSALGRRYGSDIIRRGVLAS